MANEISFAKSFLALLDTKPPKISPDHVEDPRNYPGSTPHQHQHYHPLFVFSHPFDNPLRNRPPQLPATPFDLTLLPPLTTSLAEVKEKVADETGLRLEKVKVLFGKKPVADRQFWEDLEGFCSSA
ncbi:hypothetical protein N0V88_000408 [Collariella sp. IMI 366227]|nr:hypothetical protein N0V88_000408 [Collariella sp. IMI 366227]